MTFLVAAVVLVGVLSLVNLLFTFGVIRRLREHTEILNRLGDDSHEVVMLPAGKTIEGFAATTLDGAPVSSDTMDSRLLVGFFQLGCTPCQTKLPLFVEHSRDYPGGRDQVLAVVVADDSEDPQSYIDQLAGTARVVLESPAGPVAHAFGVQGFPAFALVDAAGTVLASGSDLAVLSTTTVKV